MIGPCQDIVTVWTLNWNEQILEKKESRIKDPTTCLILDKNGYLVKSFEEVLNTAENPEVSNAEFLARYCYCNINVKVLPNNTKFVYGNQPGLVLKEASTKETFKKERPK